MLLLALDTSTRQASVALCDEDRLYGEYTWQVGNNHSVELLDRIQRLLAECSFGVSSVEGVAVVLIIFDEAEGRLLPDARRLVRFDRRAAEFFEQ